MKTNRKIKKTIQIVLLGILLFLCNTKITAQTGPPPPPPGLGFPSPLVFEEKSSQITIYPNPTVGLVTVNLSTDDQNIKILVYNIVGKLVLNTSDINTVNLGEMPSGIYIIKVITETSSFSRKITKI